MSLFRNEKIATPQILGYVDGSTANAGLVGEVISSAIAVGSAVSLTTATPANVTTLALSPGDWNLSANVNFTAASATTAVGSLWAIGINVTSSATLPIDGTEVQLFQPALTTTTFKTGDGTSIKTVSVSANTTVYLVAEATFTAGTVSAYGSLVARRVR